jgi:hypothetical protein
MKMSGFVFFGGEGEREVEGQGEREVEGQGQKGTERWRERENTICHTGRVTVTQRAACALP